MCKYMQCKLGDCCVLGERCMLGNECVLGDDCELGNGCVLGDECALGDECKLGATCELGNACRLGRRCRLGNGCTLEGGRVLNAVYCIVTNIGSRNDDAYAYCNTATGDIYARYGCWFGSLDDFTARVEHIFSEQPSEQPYVEDYRAFAEFARARFAKYGKRQRAAA